MKLMKTPSVPTTFLTEQVWIVDTFIKVCSSPSYRSRSPFLLPLSFLSLSLCARPQNNGKFCPGSGRLNQLCNTRPCPVHAVDFRAQQCAEYNSKPFRGWYYKWKPYTKVDGMTGQSEFAVYASHEHDVHQK